MPDAAARGRRRPGAAGHTPPGSHRALARLGRLDRGDLRGNRSDLGGGGRQDHSQPGRRRPAQAADRRPASAPRRQWPSGPAPAGVAEMSWILGNWRMKLLALALSIGLFAALAFSENPIQFATVDAKINYVNRPDNLVLLNQPTTTKVTISGLTQDVKNATVRADVDLSKIKKGSAFTLTPTARVFGNNVTPQSAQPITFGVDDLTTVQLDIDIRTPHVQQGWSVKKVQPICGNAAQVCKVTFTGPSSLEDGLHAFVTVDGAIATNSYDQLSSPVQFDQNGRVFDPAAQKALPLVG